MNDWATTERVRAEIIIAEGLTVAGEVHLQARVAHREGPETPLEMLNRDDAWIPLTLDDGGITFVAKAQIAVVTCESGFLPEDRARAEVVRRIELEVMLVGGAEYRGWAAAELPPTRMRALDYLNGIGKFFSLRSNGSTHFIHQRHVRFVRPLD
ncbi:MAG: hypothetical protein ACREL6_10555 [Gemmatimonadales bacterium]